jgi:hypothetical protein
MERVNEVNDIINIRTHSDKEKAGLLSCTITTCGKEKSDQRTHGDDGCLNSNQSGVMAEVKLHEGETLENALRRFIRKVLQEDIIRETKRHWFHFET